MTETQALAIMVARLESPQFKRLLPEKVHLHARAITASITRQVRLERKVRLETRKLQRQMLGV